MTRRSVPSRGSALRTVSRSPSGAGFIGAGSVETAVSASANAAKGSALGIMVVMQVFIFRDGGGKIQEIVNQKSGSDDLREATLINFVYALIILFFKEYSNLPMSTTWVFLGLLAGREIAYHWHEIRSHVATWKMIVSDLLKATAGLVVSVIIAVGLPYISQLLN